MIRVVFAGFVTGIEIPLKNGYVTELVYLEVSLAEVEAKMERNGISGSRHLIDGNVFEENIRVLKLLSLTKPPR